MPILFSQSSGSLILSLKLILISTSVLSAAVVLKFSVTALADFAVTDVPSIYNGVISWLRPPYLYLVINCIIITIVASSKLQSKVDDVAASLSPPLETTTVAQVHPQPVILPLEPIKQNNFDAFVMKGEVVEDVRPEIFGYPTTNINTDLNFSESKVLGTDDKEFINVNANVASTEVEMNSYADDSVISKSSWSPSPISRGNSSEYSFSNEKPPASARFGHRRAVKASPEGGKAALGVSKSKKQDKLESTWKTITEGRAMPLTRHLRKSGTWETQGGGHDNQTPQNQRMSKSDTFHDRIGTGDNSSNSLLSPSPGSGKLKREPSLSQDELNRRVEAFIKKFNEEMRLQRQESLNQYMEMTNRGGH